jgi:hypothetical protein
MSEIVYPIDVTLPVQDAITMNEPQWRDHMRQHHAKLAPVVNAHLERASRSVAHPVIDFLFQYYPFAPAHLMRWTPGCGVLLAGDVPPALIALKEGVQTERGWRLDAAAFPERRREAAGWVLSLLENTETRAPRYGCFGLHEWAMVYRAPEVRHARMPLRFSVEETARIVESMPVNCSHYDAFRFFTPEARPLNRLQPSLEKRRDLEQRGCLHVNMDLYKWATQFYPWISSDIIADCFLLALQIREVDMRASPYDLLALGLSPVRIETDEGRTEYVTYQQQFAEAAIPLRERLINAFRLLRGLTGSGVQPAH